jgi:WS/DGAT/MGAT family acyltransferase
MGNTMGDADRFWLCMDEPTHLMVIVGLMEFEASIDFERLQATIEIRLLGAFDRFRHRVVRPASGIGAYVWETDPTFDIRCHLHRLALPSPGGKTELNEIISDLSAMPLDMDKPPWQVHIIENDKGGCAVLFRIHHCIADGISLIHVLLSLADQSADAPWPSGQQLKKNKKPLILKPLIPFDALLTRVRDARKKTHKLGQFFLKEAISTITQPSHLMDRAQTAGGMAADIAAVMGRLAALPSDPRSPFKGPMGVHKTVVWTDPMPLTQIKEVGRAISTSTLNDILIATVTGAMRRYLRSKKIRVNHLDLKVTVPVNIRRPGTELGLGNRFSLVFLSLPVYIEDPVLRLREVKRRMDKLKKGPDAYVGYGFLSAVGKLPRNIAKRLALLFANKASGVLTNVPGPRHPLYFAGQQIENLMFWVPRSGQAGLGISILSYNGKVTVGVASDSKRMPDPEKLLIGFEDEFNELLKLVQSGKIDESPLVLHDRFEENRCQGITRAGKRCKRRPVSGSSYCAAHRPADS